MAVKVYFVWVGQGDCTLIRTENDTTILIDCGTSDNMSIYTHNIKPTIDAVMNDVGKTEIDFLIMTHSDKDHCNLIDRLSGTYTFKEVYYGGAAFQYDLFDIDLTDNTIFKTTHAISDHYYNIAIKFLNEPACEMWIVCGNYPYKKNPPKVAIGEDINRSRKRTKAQRAIYDNNGNSLMVVLYSNGYRMMFMGDATSVQQQFLYDQLNAAKQPDALNCKTIKMSHHGSSESYNATFTSQSLKPAGAFVSAGITFGHPDLDTILDITTIAKDADKHKYMAYDEDDNEYQVCDDKDYVFNTNIDYKQSSTIVKTITKSGKKNKDKHAGKPYMQLNGENVVLTITAGVGAITRGASKSLLTTKAVKDVNSRKRRKRG